VEALSHRLSDQLLAHFVFPVLFGALHRPAPPLTPSTPIGVAVTAPASAASPSGETTSPTEEARCQQQDDASAAMHPETIDRIRAFLRDSPAVPPNHVPALASGTTASAPPPVSVQSPTAAAAAAGLSPSPTVSSAVSLSPPAGGNSTVTVFPFAPLHRPVALFLLSQLFAVFKYDATLVNALACAFLHPHPPRLVTRLVQSPPLYPIKAKRPMTALLWPLAQPSTSSAASTTQPAAEAAEGRMPPASDAVSASSSVSSVIGAEGSDETVSKASSSSSLVSDSDASSTTSSADNRSVKAQDVNLRARSEPPPMGPVCSPVDDLPNVSELCESNVFRESLVACLTSHDDGLMLGAAGLLLNILRNPKTDEGLLQQSGLCTQRHLRRLALLHSLTLLTAKAPLTPPNAGSDCIVASTISNTAIDVAKPVGHVKRPTATDVDALFASATSISSPPPPPPTPPPPPSQASQPQPSADAVPSPELVMVAVPYHTPAAEANSDAASAVADMTAVVDGDAADPLMARLAPHVSMVTPVKRQTHSADATSTPAAASTNLQVDIMADRSAVPVSTTGSHTTLTHILLDAVLDALSARPLPRLVTLQLLIELLMELAHDEHNPHAAAAALIPKHRLMLRAAFELAKTDLRQRVEENVLGDAFFDTFEDECRALLSKPLNISNIIGNPTILLPVAESAISGIDFEYRLPSSGDIERTRRAIQVFLLMHNVCTKFFYAQRPSAEGAPAAPAASASASGVRPTSRSVDGSEVACALPVHLRVTECERGQGRM
jgi:hypothetical protein